MTHAGMGLCMQDPGSSRQRDPSIRTSLEAVGMNKPQQQAVGQQCAARAPLGDTTNTWWQSSTSSSTTTTTTKDKNKITQATSQLPAQPPQGHVLAPHSSATQHNSFDYSQQHCRNAQQMPHAISQDPADSHEPPDAGYRSSTVAYGSMQHAQPSRQWWHPDGENVPPPAGRFAALHPPAALTRSMNPQPGHHADHYAFSRLTDAPALPQLQGHMQRSPLFHVQPQLPPPEQQHATAAGADSMQPCQHPGNAALMSAFSPSEQNLDWQPLAPQHANPQRADPASKEARKLQARRTIYICDIDPEVKEAALANLFSRFGKIMDCRLCSDPNSALRFAFIEFDAETAVFQALRINGVRLGGGRVRVMRSRTAMNPIKQEFLPCSHEERERCGRTVYVANIDGRLEPAEVRRFFSKFCGRIVAMRLLNSNKTPTQIAFVEFADADAAAAALDCSGSLLGSQLIRVAPSKTPIRNLE